MRGRSDIDTILIPGMLPIHFEMFCNVFRRYGYNVRMLHNEGPRVVQSGLKYVHNDTCYPALLVIGQMLDALDSGEYDLKKTALLITQTGGGCRASNYIHLLRKALVKKGIDIPVYSLNFSGLEKNRGFSLTLGMVLDLIHAIVLSDAMMFAANQVRPYEREAGACDRLTRQLQEKWNAFFASTKHFRNLNLRAAVSDIVTAYAAIPVTDEKKVKTGVVGEIYIKYAALGNDHLEDYLASQGCEVMLPGLMGFLMFKADNRLEDIRLYGGNPFKKIACRFLMRKSEQLESILIDAFRATRLRAPGAYKHLKQLASRVIGPGCKMGEGWLLTAEALELVEQGYENIVCAQPFGCLPNHIVAKGMVRSIRQMYPQANLTMIDYDPGATRVNQENRIKLMLSVAKERAGLAE